MNSVLLLSSKNKNTIKSGRPVKEYDQIVRKYGDAQPMTGRLKEHEEKQKRQKENLKEYLLNVILYSERETDKYDDVEDAKREKARAKAYGVRYNKSLTQVYSGQVDVDIKEMLSERLKYTSSISGEKSYYRILEKHESIIDFLNHYTGKLLTISNAALSRPPTEYEKEEFIELKRKK